jgi:hypothetical protein
LGGEFFITSNSLNPVPGKAGSCDCDAAMVALAARAPDVQLTGLAHPADSTPPPSALPADTQAPAATANTVAAATAPNASGTGAVPPPNAMAAVAPTSTSGPNSRRPYPPTPGAPITPSSATTVNPSDPPPANAAHPAVEFSIPDSANESRPVASPTKAETPIKPEDAPTWKVMMPPLTFSSESPQPPPEPDPRSILLIRESRVEPEWLFTGHVEGGAPTGGAPSSIADSNAANGKSQSPASAAGTAGKKPKHHGFWSRMKGLFVGEPSKDQSSPQNQ